MAIKTTTTALRASMKLDNGTTAAGTKKTVSVSFPALNKDAWDATKAWAIANALDNGVLSKTLCWVEKTEVTEILDD